MKQIPLDLEEEDFVIRIHPKRDANNKWTGDVTLGIITSQDNPLSDYDYYHMMEFANMICATVPLMEFNPSFREQIEGFLEEERRIEAEKRVKTRKLNIKKKVTKGKGNIINVSFTDKVDGSA